MCLKPRKVESCWLLDGRKKIEGLALGEYGLNALPPSIQRIGTGDIASRHDASSRGGGG